MTKQEEIGKMDLLFENHTRVLKRKKFIQPSGVKVEILQMETFSKKPSELRFHAERLVNGRVQRGMYWWWRTATDRVMLDWEYFERQLGLASSRVIDVGKW